MTKKPAAARKPPALDAEAVRGAVARIEDHAGHNLAALKEHLTATHKLTLRFRSGTYTARMLGISSSNTASEGAALANWANAARRALMKARA